MLGIELAHAIDRALVEADDRDAAARLRRMAVDGLDDGVGGRAGLDLDDEADRFGEPLEDLWQGGHTKALPGERMFRIVGAREVRARIGLANLVHRQIGDPAGAVRRPVEGLVVDHGQLAVGGEVDVELDRVGPHLDAQPVGLHRVLGRHPRCPAVSDDDRHAAMPSTSASAAASSLSGSPSGTPRRMTRPTISRPNSDAIATWYAPRSSVSSSVATIAP